jgi:hypothetical protein
MTDTTSTGGAREVVARILRERYPLHSNGFNDETADDVLTRLRPIIAAEIRAWADEEIGSVASIGPVGYIQGQLDCLEIVGSNSDAIASRICGDDQ